MPDEKEVLYDVRGQIIPYLFVEGDIIVYFLVQNFTVQRVQTGKVPFPFKGLIDGFIITDPFFNTKPIGKGSGLGLAISRRIVEEHGGILEMESVENLGTRINMFLPYE